MKLSSLSRRRRIGAVCTILLATQLAACGGGDDSPAATPPPSGNNPPPPPPWKATTGLAIEIDEADAGQFVTSILALASDATARQDSSTTCTSRTRTPLPPRRRRSCGTRASTCFAANP